MYLLNKHANYMPSGTWAILAAHPLQDTIWEIDSSVSQMYPAVIDAGAIEQL